MWMPSTAPMQPLKRLPLFDVGITAKYGEFPVATDFSIRGNHDSNHNIKSRLDSIGTHSSRGRVDGRVWASTPTHKLQQ